MADHPQGQEEPEGAEPETGPSFWPILLAVGIALTLTGVVTKLELVIVGLIVVVVAAGGWAWEARRDYRALS